MKQRISELIKSNAFKQLIKYGMVGTVGLVIDMGLYYLLVSKYSVHYPFSVHISHLLGGKMPVGILDILISNIISSTLAVINNFILNSYFTFKVTDNKLKRFISFASIAVMGMIISSMLLTLFIGVMKIGDMPAKVFAICIVAAIQFAVNKFFTFKQR
jgi:putative flippase GtrA